MKLFKPGDKLIMTKIAIKKGIHCPQHITAGVFVGYSWPGYFHGIKVLLTGRKRAIQYHVSFWKKIKRKKGVV